jgi:hypothetical protein
MLSTRLAQPTAPVVDVQHFIFDLMCAAHSQWHQFHPAVVQISSQSGNGNARAHRENVIDDAMYMMGNPPHVFASSLEVT